jgi:hypothetical protein
MEMLVGEQKQDGVALLLDPAGRRSLISPFRISRKCRMFVRAEGATLVAAPAKMTTGGSSQGLLQTHVYGCTHDYYTYIVGATDRGAVGDARLAAAL